ncbi:MAG: PaaI family thioesterase [Bosea sp. (in: a-proteobacteria)]
MPDAPALMNVAELEAFLERDFPQIHHGGKSYSVESAGHGRAILRLHYQERHLRPGGTISGPSMFALADLAMYVAVLASIGPVGLAVTTNLSINFLNKPEPGDLIGTCRLLKLGKRLAVGEVSIRRDGSDMLVAHATGTYSIPPR